VSRQSELYIAGPAVQNPGIYAMYIVMPGR
jgi:hypothetical protein